MKTFNPKAVAEAWVRERYPHLKDVTAKSCFKEWDVPTLVTVEGYCPISTREYEYELWVTSDGVELRAETEFRVREATPWEYR
jgi:hypothetical protein